MTSTTYVDDHHGIGEVADEHLHEAALAVLPDQPGQVEAGSLVRGSFSLEKSLLKVKANRLNARIFLTQMSYLLFKLILLIIIYIFCSTT